MNSKVFVLILLFYGTQSRFQLIKTNPSQRFHNCFYFQIHTVWKYIRWMYLKLLKLMIRLLYSVTDLEGQNLHSIKWFKGRHEFYRYAPGDYFKKKIFVLKMQFSILWFKQKISKSQRITFKPSFVALRRLEKGFYAEKLSN